MQKLPFWYFKKLSTSHQQGLSVVRFHYFREDFIFACNITAAKKKRQTKEFVKSLDFT